MLKYLFHKLHHFTPVFFHFALGLFSVLAIALSADQRIIECFNDAVTDPSGDTDFSKFAFELFNTSYANLAPFRALQRP